MAPMLEIRGGKAEDLVARVQVDEAWSVDKALTRRVSTWEARERKQTL